MVKKINCILIILVLLLNVLFPTIVNAIDDEDVIYIDTGEDLWKIAEMVNNGDSFSGKIIELTKDIDLNCSKSKQWVPIGNFMVRLMAIIIRFREWKYMIGILHLT